MAYEPPAPVPVAPFRAREIVREWTSQQELGETYSQKRIIVRLLCKACVEESLRQSDDEDDLWQRLTSAQEILDGIWYAVAPPFARERRWSDIDAGGPLAVEIKRERGFIWRRCDPARVHEVGTNASGYSGVLRNDLASAAASYLSRPWLRLPLVDWMFVDAFVTSETIEYGEALKDRYTPGPTDIFERATFLRKHEGNLAAMTKAGRRYRPRPVRNLLLWSVFAPTVVVGVAIYADYPKTALVVAALALLDIAFIIVKLAVGGVRWTLATREQREGSKGREYALLQGMIDVWRLLAGPVVNPSILREQMVKARDGGAVFDSAAWAIVDRTMQHDPAVWIVTVDA